MMAGILGQALGWQDNPIYGAFNDNRNSLGILSGGLIGARDISDVRNAVLMGQQASATDRAEQERKNAIKEAAAEKQKSIDWLRSTQPDLAAAFDAGAPPEDVWNAAFKRMQPAEATAQDQPTSVQEYLFAKQNGYEGTFQDWQTQKGGQSEMSLTPTYARDANGNIVVTQLNKAGKANATQFPDGMTPIDPFSMAGGKTAATVDAKTAAAARAALPGAQQGLKVTLDAVDKVTGNEAGLNEWFGQIGPRGIYVNPGSPMGNFVADMSQAEGQSFLQARQFLKGQGAITELESAKAEGAYSKMTAAKASGDKAKFLEAAAEFKQAVLDGYAKLEATAQGAYAQGAPAVSSGGNTTSTGVTWSVTP